MGRIRQPQVSVSYAQGKVLIDRIGTLIFCLYTPFAYIFLCLDAALEPLQLRQQKGQQDHSTDDA